MKRLSSRFFMALGLSSLVVTALLLALFAGLVPDRDAALRASRTALAESVAISVTVLLGDEDDSRLRQVLEFVRQRNAGLQSIGLRSRDGVLRLGAGEHPTRFESSDEAGSTETHLRVPLLDGTGTWGHAELVFDPLHAPGLAGMKDSPTALIAAVGMLCFVVFYLYLGRTLRHLDPARVIPGRVRTAFDTLAEGLLVLDPKGDIVLANKAIADVLGLDADALVGKPAAQLGLTQPLQPGVAPLHWASMVVEGRTHRNVLMTWVDAAGQRRSFMVNGSPVPGAGGKPAGMLVSLDDVTALEEKEIQLRLARDAAEAANRAKSDFLANMSHEIRTPMNAILGFAELLKRGWQSDGAQAQRHLGTILSSGRHLLALINDILDLSKVEAGRLEVERLPCAVHEVVNEVATIMKIRADEKAVDLRVLYPERLPATVLTDQGRLRQIITNLVGNALKFTAAGEVTISVRLLRDGAAPQLAIDVRDSGIGIAPDKLESIFEPFVQAEASTTRQFGGTGLGLTISRKFARAMGGDITASSEPGHGSIFHLRLDPGPLSDAAWLEPDALRKPVRGPGADDGRRWVFDGQRVLVVDDGADNRELVRLVLEEAGLVVSEAENGAVALERVAADAPALLLMDMQMPVMDGLTATRRLRDAGSTLPILALTANAMKGIESEIQAAGFSGFLTKPVDIDALLAELGARLGGRQVERSTAVANAESQAPGGPLEASAAGVADNAGFDDKQAEPIISRLAHHPRLARVARNFCLALPQKLQAMEEALQAQRFDELAELAHWLKGSGGTVGYDILFEPARECELHARAGRAELMRRSLQEIRAISARLVAPAEHPAETA